MSSTVTSEKLRALLADIESDRVERTLATTNTEKFCEAICAFANDMSGSGEPGYLIVGAEDKTGDIVGVGVTDELLQRLSNYADSGQIVPLPAMVVQKVSFPEGDIAVVEVKPSDMPPVRYKGRVCIRRGPRKAIANEQEERILTERRMHHARSFDLRPCLGCERNRTAETQFQTYLRNAVAPEILEENHRDTIEQMASLGLWDLAANCTTNAGALLVAETPQSWLPGAYVQYVRFAGTDLASEVLDERRFDGDLLTVLHSLNSFIKVLFPGRPVAVSALKEELRTPYPPLAIRELLMNAVMHRDYESNAPIRFYWFSDHIEIQNPGGLYGRVTPETFPNQNDYRNPKIAEIMKTLGFVNQFGRGVFRTQDILKKNGNPSAIFHTETPAYFLATIKESEREDDSILQQ